MTDTVLNKPTLFSTIRTVSRMIKDGRGPYQVLAKQFEEMGELATEVNIAQGYMRRPAGKDGIVGEGADVLITTLDQIFLAKPDITEEELIQVVMSKLSKWLSYYAPPKAPANQLSLNLE